MKRGTIRIKDSEFLGVWVPKPLVILIDRNMGDSDRSKFLRNAIREKLRRPKENGNCRCTHHVSLDDRGYRYVIAGQPCSNIELLKAALARSAIVQCRELSN
jgi:hypothetical protein